jgi:hypothetical protein
MLGLGLHIAKSSGASPAGVEPIMAADPKVWYNENSLILPVNQYADSYIDQSGNSLSVQQPDPAKQAQIVDDGTGKKILYFTNDSLFESDLPVLSGNTDFTVLYAGAELAAYHTAIFIGDDDVPSNTSAFRLGRSNYNALRAIIGFNVAGGAFNTPYSFETNGTSDIAYAYKRGSGSSDIYIGLDNGTVAQQVQYPYNTFDLVFGDGFGIGTNNPDDPSATGTGTGWFLFEVLVYERALTDIELAQTRQYLREKWNI